MDMLEQLRADVEVALKKDCGFLIPSDGDALAAAIKTSKESGE